MIEKKMDELFESITNSVEYQKYRDITKLLEDDEEIKELIEEIKRLQKESVNLEYQHDMKYKEIDEVIEKKVKELNGIPKYQEYLNRMEELNEILRMSSHMLEDYVNDKI